jgi:uncharacterized protein involved in outer membrane biogenesis
MRISRRAVVIAGAALLLALGAIGVAVFTLDLNQLVGPVLARLKAATGREITVGGNVALRIGMRPRIVAHDVRVANAPWGKAPHFITAKSLEMQVALLPLLRRDFELIRLNVVEPVIALETSADGKNNWDLGDAPKTATPPTVETRPGAFVLGDLTMSHGELTYRGASGGEAMTVAIDDFALKAADRQSPVKAQFKGAIDDLPVALEGTVGPIATFNDRGTPYPVRLKGEVAGRKTALVFDMKRDDKGTVFDGLDLVHGASDIKGKVDIRDAPRALWIVSLISGTLDLNELSSERKGAASAKAAPARAAGSNLVFSDAPVSFDALRGRNATGDVAVDHLVLPGGRKVERVQTRFSVADAKLDAPHVQAVAYGGTVAGSVSIDARTKAPAIAVKLEGRELDLSALLTAAGVNRQVKGGKTIVTIDLAMRGNSPHQWMSGAGGHVQAVVGPATLVNTKIDTGAAFDKLAEAVNPFRAVKPSTELRCAVVRLPLANGVANVDRSIALETHELDVSMSGKLDFRNETLDLSIRPKVRQGIPIEIPQMAELVRFTGPFTAPTVSVDAVASATAIARIGAAIGTGGLSVLGETLLKAGSAGAGACDVALGKGGGSSAPAAAPTSTKSAPPSNPVEGIGSALKGLFGK